MPIWTLVFEPAARKQLRSLPLQERERINAFLRDRLSFDSNPRQLAKKMVGQKKVLWRFRVGDYRIIAELRDQEWIILVVAIGHRREVYR
jgi:mRNA interferase RelE/StbE